METEDKWKMNRHAVSISVSIVRYGGKLVGQGVYWSGTIKILRRLAEGVKLNAKHTNKMELLQESAFFKEEVKNESTRWVETY